MTLRSTAPSPRISIIIPNYNGGKTIEATLRSIIDQNYPNLELIVIDGASKDNSVDIIKKYESHIACWESVRDRGQSHAINKGFDKCTGDVVNWICSDDLLTPGSLQKIADAFHATNCDVVVGKCLLLFPDDPAQDQTWGPTADQIAGTLTHNRIPQPSCFYKRSLLQRSPVLCEDFNYAMDTELWGYLLSRKARWTTIDDILSKAIQDGNNKSRTADYRLYVELDRIHRRYADAHSRSPAPLWFRTLLRPWIIYLEKPRGPVGRTIGQCAAKCIISLYFVGRSLKRTVRGSAT